MGIDLTKQLPPHVWNATNADTKEQAIIQMIECCLTQLSGKKTLNFIMKQICVIFEKIVQADAETTEYFRNLLWQEYKIELVTPVWVILMPQGKK